MSISSAGAFRSRVLVVVKLSSAEAKAIEEANAARITADLIL
jgi:hypothetical protein